MRLVCSIGRSSLWLLIAALSHMALAVDPNPATPVSFAEALAAANNQLSGKKFADALQAYQQAKIMARSDPERAEAQLGIAEANAGLLFNPDPDKILDAFTVLGDNLNLSALKKLRTRMGLARAMYGMGYLTDAKIHYLEALLQISQIDKVPVSQQVPPMSPYDRNVYLNIRQEMYDEAKSRVEEIAAKAQ